MVVTSQGGQQTTVISEIITPSVPTSAPQMTGGSGSVVESTIVTTIQRPNNGPNGGNPTSGFTFGSNSNSGGQVLPTVCHLVLSQDQR